MTSDRPELLLLAGLLCDATIWAPVSARLKDLAEVTIVDFAGLSAIEDMARHAPARRSTFKSTGLALHRAPDRLAQCPTAIAGRRGQVTTVTATGTTLTGHAARLAEHQDHRHRQTMIDLHLVDDGRVELVEDAGLRDVPGQVGMSRHHQHRARSWLRTYP